MGGIDADSDGSYPGARGRFRFLCSVRCTWRLGLQIELGCASDVRENMKLSFSIMVRCG